MQNKKLIFIIIVVEKSKYNFITKPKVNRIFKISNSQTSKLVVQQMATLKSFFAFIVNNKDICKSLQQCTHPPFVHLIVFVVNF